MKKIYLAGGPERCRHFAGPCKNSYLDQLIRQKNEGPVLNAALQIDVLQLSTNNQAAAYQDMFSTAFRYLQTRADKGTKPNVEASIASRFGRTHTAAQKAITKSGLPTIPAHIKAALPAQGIQDHTINRLLLMSSSEHHLSAVPMAFFVERPSAQAESVVGRPLLGLS